MNLADATVDFDNDLYGAVADGTRSWYMAALARFSDYLGDVDLAAITAADVRRWRRSLAESLAPSTVNTYITAVTRFLNWCVEQGYLESSPAGRVRRMRVVQVPRAIGLDDAQRLVDYLAGQKRRRDLAIVLFLLSTGARVGGLVGLTLDRLNLENGHAVVVEKGGRSRMVFLSPPVAALLDDYIRLDRPDAADPHVFLSSRRRGLTRQAVWAMLKTAGDKLGIERINPHSFRHAFAIGQLTNGNNLLTVSRLMGHADVRTTQIYAMWDTAGLKDLHGRHDVVANLDFSLPAENGKDKPVDL